MILGVLKKIIVLPRLLFNYNNGDWTNTGSLGPVNVGSGSSGGASYTFSGGTLTTTRISWGIVGSGGLALANQPFEFGADITILVAETFPFLNKVDAHNGGWNGWSVGFMANGTPYFKDVATNTVSQGTSAAPFNTAFTFKVVSDGLNHQFFINGVSAGTVVQSTNNMSSSYLLYVTSSYSSGSIVLDNLYFN